MAHHEITEVSSIFHTGSRYLRRATVQYLQYIFSTCSLHEEFKWSDDKNTKVHITSNYPDVSAKYPHIVVGSTGYKYIVPGFSGHLGTRLDEGLPLEYGGRQKSSGLSIQARTLTQDKTEEIIELVDIAFVLKPFYDAYVKTTHIYPSINDIEVSDITESPLSGTNKMEWIGTLRMPVSVEFFVKVDAKEVETIASELVESDLV